MPMTEFTQTSDQPVPTWLAQIRQVRTTSGVAVAGVGRLRPWIGPISRVMRMGARGIKF